MISATNFGVINVNGSALLAGIYPSKQPRADAAESLA
jgi:hypothetical protein